MRTLCKVMLEPESSSVPVDSLGRDCPSSGVERHGEERRNERNGIQKLNPGQLGVRSLARHGTIRLLVSSAHSPRSALRAQCHRWVHPGLPGLPPPCKVTFPVLCADRECRPASRSTLAFAGSEQDRGNAGRLQRCTSHSKVTVTHSCRSRRVPPRRTSLINNDASLAYRFPLVYRSGALSHSCKLAPAIMRRAEATCSVLTC